MIKMADQIFRSEANRARYLRAARIQEHRRVPGVHSAFGDASVKSWLAAFFAGYRTYADLP